jgi:hypothetical protein
LEEFSKRKMKRLLGRKKTNARLILFSIWVKIWIWRKLLGVHLEELQVDWVCSDLGRGRRGRKERGAEGQTRLYSGS